MHLFIKDFLWVYAIALAVASSITYYLLYRWLVDFHLKTKLNLWGVGIPIFALSGLAFAFIGTQSLRAVRMNPVDSLRDE